MSFPAKASSCVRWCFMFRRRRSGVPGNKRQWRPAMPELNEIVVSPMRIAPRPEINRGPVVEPYDLPMFATALLLDVRSRDAFAQGHLRRAVRLPIERWEEAAKD